MRKIISILVLFVVGFAANNFAATQVHADKLFFTSNIKCVLKTSIRLGKITEKGLPHWLKKRKGLKPSTQCFNTNKDSFTFSFSEKEINSVHHFFNLRTLFFSDKKMM